MKHGTRVAQFGLMVVAMSQVSPAAASENLTSLLDLTRCDGTPRERVHCQAIDGGARFDVTERLPGTRADQLQRAGFGGCYASNPPRRRVRRHRARA